MTRRKFLYGRWRMRRLVVERLETRDAPAVLAGFRPHLPVRDGVHARDFEQGYVAGDCSAVATLASGVRAGVDWASRVIETSLYNWDVSLFHPSGSGEVTVHVVFNGRLLPTDPTCRNGEFLSLLLLRAYHKLVPTVIRQGDSLERTALVFLGSVPTHDDTPRAVGWVTVRDALAGGNVATLATDAHAFAVMRLSARYVILYDPHGFFRRITAVRFLSGPYEVAVTGR
jgi:hypothetical protein